MGLVCALIYILLLILFIPFVFSDFFGNQPPSHRKPREGLTVDEFPHHEVQLFRKWLPDARRHRIRKTGDS
ncbi:hypothetical protein B0H21DRAFT_740884 [Amylocystis lapponica]|nr:hypothetical protein B0H21DRAFT_740884 [Amylocystis lapponica]